MRFRIFVLLLCLTPAPTGCSGDKLSAAPDEELCDGEDNDFDPDTPDGADEPLIERPTACDGDDSDLCEEGVLVCRDGAIVCDDASDDNAELCNALDDDCDPSTGDGADDPMVNEPCDGDDADFCPEGTLLCAEGGLHCTDQSADNPEICDGLDNDCDPSSVDGSDVLFVPSLTTCTTSWDRRPVVELDPLPIDHTYELYKDDDAAPYGTVTLPGQNYYRPEEALTDGGPPPGASTSIYVVSCTGVEARCCAATETVTVRMVEECTTPIEPTDENILVSEYVTNGDGNCPGTSCEAGEAFEITNLSHCPVSLENFHFSYCNPGSCATFRWMDFDATSIVPPRGVYVAVRNLSESLCEYPFFGPNDPGIFGSNLSVLQMESNNTLSTGWFNNTGGGKIRIASGMFSTMTAGDTFALISPYLGAAGHCESIGFNAWDACGNITAVSTPNDVLTPNQLGRLWHPCNAVVSPVPDTCE